MEEAVNGPRWIHCPVCGSKTRVRVYWDTVLVHFPLYCTRCKREMRVDVVQFKMVPSRLNTKESLPSS